MKSKTTGNPLPSLPNDVLTKILTTAVGENPGKYQRDINSLATTNKAMYLRTKKLEGLWFKTQWPAYSADLDCAAQLKKVRTAPKDSDIRLYSEPVLRQIGKTAHSLEKSGKANFGTDFWLRFYAERQSVSMSEVADCIKKISSLKSDVRCAALVKLADSLDGLNVGQRRDAVVQILKASIQKYNPLLPEHLKAVIDKLRKVAASDQDTLAVLNLNIILSKKVATQAQADEAHRNYALLTPDKRWDLLTQYVPNIFTSSAGFTCLAPDKVCQKKFIAHISQCFLDAKTHVREKLDICRRAAYIEDPLCESEEGRALLTMTSDWLIDNPAYANGKPPVAPIVGEYLYALSANLMLYSDFLTEKKCAKLKARVENCITYLDRGGFSKHLNSLIKNAAMVDVKLLPKLNLASAMIVAAVETTLMEFSTIEDQPACYAAWEVFFERIVSSQKVLNPNQLMRLKSALTSALDYLPEDKREKSRRKIDAKFKS